MTHYSVLAVTPTSDDWIPAYLAAANALVAKHGGRYLARTGSHEQVEGPEAPAAMRIIIEWPSKEAATAFINDPDYRPHLEARAKGSQSVHFLVEARDDAA